MVNICTGSLDDFFFLTLEWEKLGIHSSLTFPPSDLCIKESQVATLLIFFPGEFFLDNKSYFP